MSKDCKNFSPYEIAFSTVCGNGYSCHMLEYVSVAKAKK